MGTHVPIQDKNNLIISFKYSFYFMHYFKIGYIFRLNMDYFMRPRSLNILNIHGNNNTKSKKALGVLSYLIHK